MKPGPITSTTFPPDYSEATYVIESFDPIRYAQTVERNPVSPREHELDAFHAEVARLEALRNSTTDWDPIVVRLLCGDQEIERKKIACLRPPLFLVPST